MIPTYIPTPAAQKEHFPLAGMLRVVKFFSLNGMANLLSIVKVFGVSECGKNLIKPDTKAASNGVSRQVRGACEDLSDVTTRGRQGFSNITTRAEELPRQNRVSRLPGGLYATVRAREEGLSDISNGLSDISTASNEDFCGVTTRGYEGFSIITTREEDFNYITTRDKTVSVSQRFDNSGNLQVYRYFGTSTHKAGIEFCQSIKRYCSGFIEQYARAREDASQIDQEPPLLKSYGPLALGPTRKGQIDFSDMLEIEFLESIKKAVIEFFESIKKGRTGFRAQYAHVWLYDYAEFSGTLVQVFSESIKKECARCPEPAKKNLPLFRFTVYGNSAPAKSGAGIGVLEIITATPDAPSVFFCVVHSVHPFFCVAVIIRAAHEIMVGCVGASFEAPVSVVSGYANPIQSTTLEIGVSGGGYPNHTSEAAIWLLPPPKNHLLSGAFTLASNPAISLLLLILNPKLVLCYLMPHVCLLLASVQEAHMLNQFTVLGYGTNQRGLTIGINYKITSDSTATATAHAMLQAQHHGLTRITITRVMGATA